MRKANLSIFIEKIIALVLCFVTLIFMTMRQVDIVPPENATDKYFELTGSFGNGETIYLLFPLIGYVMIFLIGIALIISAVYSYREKNTIGLDAVLLFFFIVAILLIAIAPGAYQSLYDAENPGNQGSYGIIPLSASNPNIYDCDITLSNPAIAAIVLSCISGVCLEIGFVSEITRTIIVNDFNRRANPKEDATPEHVDENNQASDSETNNEIEKIGHESAGGSENTNSNIESNPKKGTKK